MSATNRRKIDNKNDECSKRIRSYKNTRHGTPEGTRTPDLLIRSQSLYPTELPAHTSAQRSNILAQADRFVKRIFAKSGFFSEQQQITRHQGQGDGQQAIGSSQGIRLGSRFRCGFRDGLRIRLGSLLGGLRFPLGGLL